MSIVADLTTKHKRMLEYESAISPEIIEARGYQSISDEESRAFLKSHGFQGEQLNLGAGLAMPLYHCGISQAGMSYRPDTPRVNEDDKPLKYEVPHGHIHALDGTPTEFIREGVRNPNMELWITEGMKKGDAAVSHGLVCLNLHGTWGFMGRNEYGGTSVIPDFKKNYEIAWKNKETNAPRAVVICFDSDIMKQPGVNHAARVLGETIKRYGARVEYAILDPINETQKQGLDDYLARGGRIQDIKRVTELPPLKYENFPREDLEIAEVLSTELQTKLAFDPVSMQWFHYNQPMWESIDRNDVGTIIARATRDMGGVYVTHSKALSISNFMQTDMRRTFNTTLLDLYPFRNGVLNVTMGDFREGHRPEDWMAWNLGYDYDPTATCPVFDEFLHFVTGEDQSLQQVLLAFMKATLEGRVAPGRPALKKYLYLVGQPHTGKSQFANLLQMLVGSDNTVSTDIDIMTGANSRFETARLYNQKLTIFKEAQRFLKDTSILKSITGGDAVRFEIKSEKKISSFTYYGMVLMHSNFNQVSPDTDEALQDRILVVEFNKRKDAEDRIALCEEDGRGFKGAFIPELPGIFNRVMQIKSADLPALLDKHNNLKLMKMWQNHFEEGDHVARFVKHHLEHDSNGKVKAGTKDRPGLLSAYNHFVQDLEITGGKLNHISIARRVVEACHSLGWKDVYKGDGSPSTIYNVRLKDGQFGPGSLHEY